MFCYAVSCYENKMRLIGQFSDERKAYLAMVDFATKEDARFCRTPFVRCWEENGLMFNDIGSHTILFATSENEVSVNEGVL